MGGIIKTLDNFADQDSVTYSIELADTQWKFKGGIFVGSFTISYKIGNKTYNVQNDDRALIDARKSKKITINSSSYVTTSV